jgi:formate C-acetyltransferase
MTERIGEIRSFLLDKKHLLQRHGGMPYISAYRDPALSAAKRSAMRLSVHLAAEQPVIYPFERIVFTRTQSTLPMIYSPEEWEKLRAGRFIHELGNVCNLSPDYGKILDGGLQTQIFAIEKAKERFHGDADKLDELTAMQSSIDALLNLVSRYEALARILGQRDIADVLARVPMHGARTLQEALQSFRILHFALWCEGDYHNTVGRFDQYMLPYLEADLKAGRLNEEEALELIEEFFLTFNRDSDLYPGIQQGDNGQSMVLGGITPSGGNGYNCLSELCLAASKELRLIDPKINLRVGHGTPLSVYENAAELTRLGLGFPQYENDDVVIPGLMKLGYAERDARNYVVAACWEFIIPGAGMDIPNIAALSFARAAKDAMTEGLQTARNEEDLLKLTRRHIHAQIDEIERTVKNLYVIPSPYMSLFFEGCAENGRDISLGCRYNNYGIHGTGLATAADSIAAASQAVFREGLSPDTLLDALQKDFEGYGVLQHHLKFDMPKMGNDDEGVDSIAVSLLSVFAEDVKGRVNQRGGIFRAGTGSAMFYLRHAGSAGATADGRNAKDPLPANYAPSLYARLNGPASILRSFTKPDLTQVINGGPLTLEFHDSVFRNPEAITKVAMLVRSFMLGGGHQLQLNTVNRDRLLDAKKHPENYKNLIVRVWGWSGYFVELDECYQDHIIQRMELMA